MSPVIDVSIKKTVLYNFAINMNRHKNNYFVNMNGSRITSSSIFQSLISDHKKRLKACLQWKVHLASQLIYRHSTQIFSNK